jgi:predicted small lipoprotein YifL
MLIFMRDGQPKHFVKTPMQKLFLIVTIAGLLTACGSKGPLYLPSQKPGAQAPAPAPTANTAPADEKKSLDGAKP